MSAAVWPSVLDSGLPRCQRHRLFRYRDRCDDPREFAANEGNPDQAEAELITAANLLRDIGER